MELSLQEPIPLSWVSQISIDLGKESLEFHKDGIGWDDMGQERIIWEEIG